MFNFYIKQLVKHPQKLALTIRGSIIIVQRKTIFDDVFQKLNPVKFKTTYVFNR